MLVGINEQHLRMVAYALGFACGNYIVCVLEDKLALGLMTINSIVSEKDGEPLADILRAEKVGVTLIEAEGLKEDKKMLILHVKRKIKYQIIKLIQNSGINAVISLMETKTTYSGYGIRE